MYNDNKDWIPFYVFLSFLLKDNECGFEKSLGLKNTSFLV